MTSYKEDPFVEINENKILKRQTSQGPGRSMHESAEHSLQFPMIKVVSSNNKKKKFILYNFKMSTIFNSAKHFQRYFFGFSKKCSQLNLFPLRFDFVLPNSLLSLKSLTRHVIVGSIKLRHL